MNRNINGKLYIYVRNKIRIKDEVSSRKRHKMLSKGTCGHNKSICGNAIKLIGATNEHRAHALMNFEQKSGRRYNIVKMSWPPRELRIWLHTSSRRLWAGRPTVRSTHMLIIHPTIGFHLHRKGGEKDKASHSEAMGGTDDVCLTEVRSRSQWRY